MIRGGVYPIDLGDPKRGREQGGKRYGVVMSGAPDSWSVVTVLPTSTSAQDAIFRPRLIIAGESTLVLCDMVRAIDLKYVLSEPVDYLTGSDMAEVEDAFARYHRLQFWPGC